MRCHIELNAGRLLWTADATLSPFDNGSFPDVNAPELCYWLEVAASDYFIAGFDVDEIKKHIAEQLEIILPKLPTFSDEPTIGLPPKFAADIKLQSSTVPISELISRI